MKITNEGLELIKQAESFKPLPYLCPAKVPTIGYGSTFYSDGTKVSMNDKAISKELATELLIEVASEFGSKLLFKKTLTDNQYSACVSLAYNIGVGAFNGSTLLKKININPNDETIFDEFLKWNKAGGKVLQGLVIRRNKEARLYFQK
jgi:lysozyme